MRDKDIFALHLPGRPSDEGARFARKVQCKDRYLDLSRWRLKNPISFQFEVICGLITKFNVLFHFIVVFFLKTRGVIFASHYSEMKFLSAKHDGCKDNNIPALHFQVRIEQKSKDTSIQSCISTSYAYCLYVYDAAGYLRTHWKLGMKVNGVPSCQHLYIAPEWPPVFKNL